MRKKIGWIISSCPIGIVLILAEYYAVFAYKWLFVAYLLFVPLLSVSLVQHSVKKSISKVFFPATIVSTLSGTLLFYLVGAPPNYWLKPFTPFSLSLSFALLIFMLQLILLMFFNMFKGIRSATK